MHGDSLTHGAKKYVYIFCSINGVCWTHGAKRELKHAAFKGCMYQLCPTGGVCEILKGGVCVNPWRKAPSRDVALMLS